MALEASDTAPRNHLAIDRNARAENEAGSCDMTRPGYHGCVTIMFPENCYWDNTIHASTGNVGIYDGSVQQLNTRGLMEYMTQTGDTNLSNCVLQPKD